ncbi:MAG: hypothetical protein AN488_13505 [Anabaena sp. WA113]|jgi:hypothetical protein|nr:MAG: hypothetical protein AN488_13505 [Anabaena sp. WA113]
MLVNSMEAIILVGIQSNQMAKNKIGNIPFPPLVKIDVNEPLSVDEVTKILKSRDEGISICVRSQEGHPDRGGYFFHILPKDKNITQCEIYNFEKISVSKLELSELTDFINHCSGLQFSKTAFHLCQSVINFRLDPE